LQVCLNAQAKSLKKERNELIEEISMDKRQEKLLKKEIASCQQVLEEMRAKWTCFQEKQSQMEALSQEIK
jgi:hypothetical protein